MDSLFANDVGEALRGLAYDEVGKYGFFKDKRLCVFELSIGVCASEKVFIRGAGVAEREREMERLPELPFTRYSKSESTTQNIPFPCSPASRGTFLNALFKERLCLTEF